MTKIYAKKQFTIRADLVFFEQFCGADSIYVAKLKMSASKA